MVLAMARRSLDRVNSDQKRSMGELVNKSRKPRDPTKNRHIDSLKTGQLTLSQGVVKKGDDVAFDDDDGGQRIVSQDSVYIALSTYQTGKNEGGRKQMVNTTLRSVLAGFTTPS
jgi:hypothetical protein